ncbi:MAG TPA: DUF1080 domain-containing protein [Verrucomicrobiae bacterium]
MRVVLKQTGILLLALMLGGVVNVQAKSEKGFVSLFDGQSLKGWTRLGGKESDYGVKDGVIFAAKGVAGNLVTDKQYEDFTLRLEFKLQAAGNNGVGIRAPYAEKNISYDGMEIQILDDTDPKYKDLKPWQVHGSVYGVIPAKRTTLKPLGEWNEQEITCIGRKIQVKVNGKVVVDGDLNDVTDTEVIQKHPGIFREKGHIALLGHTDYVEFRNIRVKEFVKPEIANRVPAGFKRLFSGFDLKGWQGLVEDPVKRKALPIDEWARKQVEADKLMEKNWVVNRGVLSYVGDGFDNLCTVREYGNFEMVLDWKIQEKGDSGVYVRGTPQIQIWDEPVGSGGLFNNKVNADKPLKRADYFVGEWNRMRMVMIGDKVMVFLNDELVTYDAKKKTGTAVENYWERDKPLYPWGPIELQAHKTPVHFKNVFIRELP